MEALIRQIEKLLQIKITDMNGDIPKTTQELAIEEGKIFRELDHLYEEGFLSLRDARNMKLALQAKYHELARKCQQKEQEKIEVKSAKEALLAELRKKREEIDSKPQTEDWLEEINQELRAMGFDIPVTEIEEPEHVEPIEGHQRLF